MKFLAVYSAGSEENARRAKDGEPCVSNFRVCGQNMFLGLETYNTASYAKTKEFDDAEIDKLFEGYKKQYPSLPENVLEKYFLASAEAALKFKNEKKIRVAHDPGDTTKFYSPDTGTTLEVNLE